MHSKESDLKIKKIHIDDIIKLNEVERKFAPEWLYAAGNIDIAKIVPRVSIIGTRHPTEIGVKNTESIVNSLVKRNIIVVSGLALGVDTVAHRTAIDKGGKTIAVLGNPLDQYYPKENYKLQKEIIQKHLAISQFQIGTPIQPKNFPIRNRTMALISNASVIVEAGENSGSHHQGWEALRLGRPLFILDTILDSETLSWPNKMIKYGAQVLSIKGIKLLEEVIPPHGVEDNHVTLYA